MATYRLSATSTVIQTVHICVTCTSGNTLTVTYDVTYGLTTSYTDLLAVASATPDAFSGDVSGSDEAGVDAETRPNPSFPVVVRFSAATSGAGSPPPPAEVVST